MTGCDGGEHGRTGSGANRRAEFPVPSLWAKYGFVCIIAVLYSWYYTAVLYSSLKPNEYYTVRMSPLRSPNESVESVEFRLQRIGGLLACYKV
jgi:hypothetical protein